MMQRLRGILGRIDVSLPCKSLCRRDLRRPHITCLYCRIRRMHYRRMPSLIEVQVYYIAVQRRPPRRLARVKDILFRRILNIAEFLAT